MIRVGVVGAGRWGSNLVRVFHELGSLYAVADNTPQIQSEIQSCYPGVKVFNSLDDILSDANVDAVALATPAPDHALHINMALQAKKHVFVEKPMTLSVAQAEDLLKKAENCNQILMVGHLLLYDPAIQEIKRLLDNNAIGQLHSIHQERCKLGKIRSVENVLWSFGVHDLAVIQYLVNRDLKGVQVSQQAVIQSGIADDVYVHLCFAGNVRTHLHVSWLWPENRRCLTIIGTKGAIIYDEPSHTLTLKQFWVDENLQIENLGTENIAVSCARPLTLECQHFLDCIMNDMQPISDVRQGLAVVRMLEWASNPNNREVAGHT